MAFIRSFAFPDFLDSLVSLFAAFVLGTLIGAERQYRQRGGGLRTHVLVAVGAATFVDIGMRINGNQGATQIIAYVVSGVGFLGAGVIMKQGSNVWGLNTAATLWCSAAVGACAGADLAIEAVALTCFVLAGNTLLRPLVNAINRASHQGVSVPRTPPGQAGDVGGLARRGGGVRIHRLRADLDGDRTRERRRDAVHPRRQPRDRPLGAGNACAFHALPRWQDVELREFMDSLHAAEQALGRELIEEL
jgi:hypothetical protein